MSRAAGRSAAVAGLTPVVAPYRFAWLFVVLLVLDVAWALLAAEFLVVGVDLGAQRSWLTINLTTSAILVLLILGYRSGLWYFLPLVAFTRTVADYGSTWRFYTAA